MMQMDKNKIILTAVVLAGGLFLQASSTLGLKCYMCTTRGPNRNSCLDPRNSEINIRTCPEGYTCIKHIKYERGAPKSGVNTAHLGVRRDCDKYTPHLGPAENCSKLNTGDSQQIEIRCLCSDSDLCNNSVRISQHNYLIITLIVLFLALYFGKFM